jgi:hypothetical protein
MQVQGAAVSVKGLLLAAGINAVNAGSAGAGLADVAEMAIGELTANSGTAVTVTLDFDPSFVMLINETNVVALIGLKTATTANNILKLKGTGPTITIVSAAVGIAFGAAGAHTFTLGTDADMNSGTTVVQYVAFGK